MQFVYVFGQDRTFYRNLICGALEKTVFGKAKTCSEEYFLPLI